MSPEERTEAIQTLAGQATHDNLAVAPLLYAARDEKDYVKLGLESWSLYLDSVGVSRSTDSKLRKAYSVFGEDWSRAMVDPRVTLERLYAAARVTLKEGLDAADGYALAEMWPSADLVARLKDEDFDPEMCACPECGHSHKRKEPR